MRVNFLEPLRERQRERKQAKKRDKKATRADDVRGRDRDSEREESTKGGTECTYTGGRDGVYDACGEKRMGHLQD